MTLPTGVLLGRVTGRFLAVQIDIPTDSDEEPQGIPCQGVVTFKASPSRLIDAGDKAFLLPQPFQVALDPATGKLKSPDGTEGITLVATDSPMVNPIDWTWNVSFNFTNAQMNGFNFQLPNGTTVDLAQVVPLDTSPGTLTIAGPPGAGTPGPAGVGAPPAGTPDGKIAKSLGGSTVWVDPPSSIADIELDPGWLATTGIAGDYAVSAAGICTITGDIDVRWFGAGYNPASTGSFRSIVNIAGAIDFRQQGSNGKPQLVVSNGASTQNCNIGAATLLTATGLRVTWRASDGQTKFYTLDPAGTVTTVDGKKWTQVGTTVNAVVSGNQLTAGSKKVSVGGLYNNGTEPNKLATTRVEIYSGIDGTLSNHVDFTGHNRLDTVFTDGESNTWNVMGFAEFETVAGSIAIGSTSIELATLVDIQRAAGGVGWRQPNPLTGCFHPEDFGPDGVDPQAWTTAQTGAAVRAARDAAVLYTILGKKLGTTLKFGARTYVLDPDTSVVDPFTGQPYAALRTWDFLTFLGSGRDSTILQLAPGANCHVIGHPGRLQASGQEDKIFNFSIENMKIDGNKSLQDGSRWHNGLHIHEHTNYRIANVRVTNCNGDGVYTTANGQFFSSPATSPGVNIVRPTWVIDLETVGNDKWGMFFSATNRDTNYNRLNAYSNGNPQAQISGKTLATTLGASGTLKLLIDDRAEVDVTLASGDTPANVVSKINTALGNRIAMATNATITRFRAKITDGVFNGTTNFNSPAQAAFTAADVDQVISGDKIPVGTKIVAYVDTHNVTLNNVIPAATGVNVQIGTNIILTTSANSATWTVGAKVSAIGLPTGARIGAVVNGASFTVVDALGKPITPNQNFPNSTGVVTIDAKGVASLASGRVLITSDSFGGNSKVNIVNSSTGSVLTSLGFTTAPDNGDLNYRCGANECGGIYFDHSECLIFGAVADSNYGDGIYIHNVNACHYFGFHATRNAGYGIYVDALNHSTGGSWYSAMNCTDFGAANYRSTVMTTAEVYFDSGVEGYGITKDSTIEMIAGPGDRTTIGSDNDNRFAAYSVYIADNITLTYGTDQPDSSSLRISTINAGDGGLVGTIRYPAAYLPSGRTSSLPAGILAPGRYDPNSHVYTPAGGQTPVKLAAKLAQTRKGVGRTKIAFIGASNVAGYNGASSLRGVSDYPFQVSEAIHAAGWDASEPVFTFNDAVAGDNRGAISGTWTYSTHPANAVYVAGLAASTLTCQCTRQGDTVEIAVAGTSAAFTVQIDGQTISSTFPGLSVVNGSYSTTFATPDGGAHITKFTFPGLSLGAHTIKITNVGGVIPFWVDCYNSKGVSIANFGSSGTRTADWNDTSLYYTLLNEVISWGPDLVVLDTALQFNSWQGAEAFATSLANMAAVVATLKAAGIEVFLNGVTPAISPTIGTPPLAFWQNLFSLADATTCQMLENYSAWGSSEATASTNGLIGGADTVHPSASGYAAIAKSIATAWSIVPFKRLLPLKMNDGTVSAALPAALSPNTVTKVNPTAGGFAVTFPTAPADGTLMSITNVGTNANVVTITPGGTDTINGVASISAGYSGIWIYSLADTTWFLLSDARTAAAPTWAATTAYSTGQTVLLPTGGRAFRTTAGTSRASFDSTERALWTFIPGGHYEKLTASGNWVCPTGITHARFKLQGAGGGGGGGTSSATINAQAGASGAGAGMGFQFDEIALVAGTSYAYTHGVGGAGGVGGTVGGHPGANGSDGGDGVFVGVSTTKTAKGGCKGFTNSATDTIASVGGGIYGWPSGQNSATVITNGCGGASGVGSVWEGDVVGGGGSGATSATLGGLGGPAATALGMIVGNTAAGSSATINGGNGTTATVDGCGGGAGGAGHKADGTGGNGGNGADGYLKVWY